MVCGVLPAAADSTTLINREKKKILAPISTSLLFYLFN
jgi:hypothetical protein